MRLAVVTVGDLIVRPCQHYFYSFVNNIGRYHTVIAAIPIFFTKLVSAHKTTTIWGLRSSYTMHARLSRLAVTSIHSRHTKYPTKWPTYLYLGLPVIGTVRMRSRVCVSVRLSTFTAANSLLQVCCCGLGEQMSINCCMAGAQQQRRAADECGQCHVVSLRRKLNTDLLVYLVCTIHCFFGLLG